MGWYSEEELLADIVAQTAEFRYRICWAGGRRLVEQRGIDPMRCLQLSCDQGDDVNGTLVLPDGTVINFDMREDPKTRELVSVSRWEPVSYQDREVAIAREIVSAPDSSSFDRRVRDYFEKHWMHRDAPLPPTA
ncbi:MAG TPA: hypothetical protein VFB66_18050 [Tepidisphaeraceae bacterium]|nr:hypothetical protein [Tepidisphaeraceae bacterium]